MKKMISVTGPADSGKSTCIKEACDRLRTKFPKAQVETLRPGRGKDYCVVITIDGVLVGIDSRGDPDNELDESLAELAGRGCNVIVCASRTRGETYDAVSAYDGQYHLVRIAKRRDNNDEPVIAQILRETLQVIRA